VGSRLSRGRECDRRRGQRWEDPAPAACLAETPRPERRATPPWCPTWCAQPSTAPVTMAAPFPPPPWDALQRGDPAALPTVHDLPLAQVRFPAHPPAATSCAAVRRVARPPARCLPSSSPAIANLSALVTTALPPLSSASLSLVPARPFVATPSVLALCLQPPRPCCFAPRLPHVRVVSPSHAWLFFLLCPRRRSRLFVVRSFERLAPAPPLAIVPLPPQTRSITRIADPVCGGARHAA
jgi:hypothetical protein